MFEHGFPKDWSTLKKLIWILMAMGGGSEDAPRVGYAIVDTAILTR